MKIFFFFFSPFYGTLAGIHVPQVQGSITAGRSFGIGGSRRYADLVFADGFKCRVIQTGLLALLEPTTEVVPLPLYLPHSAMSVPLALSHWIQVLPRKFSHRLKPLRRPSLLFRARSLVLSYWLFPLSSRQIKQQTQLFVLPRH